MNRPQAFLLLLAAGGLACAAATRVPAAAAPAPDGEMHMDPYDQARWLGKGINFGNLLDAAPDEGAWTGGQRIQPADFDLARSAGFESVRLPVRFSAHAAATAPYTIKTAFMGPSWGTTGITWPGPPATPVTAAEGVEPWVKDWIRDYDTLPAARNPGGEAWVRDELARAAAWGQAHRRPLWMSEFTAQDGAPLESRARWMAFVRTELERLEIPWSAWTLDSDRGSRLYDPGTRRWNLELTRALGLAVTNE